MKQVECSYEARILEVSHTGEWTEALRAHVAGCDLCADAALVSGYLFASAEVAATAADLSSVGRIWWRAQNVAKVGAMERALRPIVWARRFAFAACGAVLIPALFTWRLQLVGFIRSLLQTLAPRPSAIPAGHANILLLVTALFLVMLVPVVFGLYVAWSED